MRDEPGTLSCAQDRSSAWCHQTKEERRLRYDFDRPVQREGTGSVKWDGRKARFGAADVVPLWVADMDFQAPKPVLDALAERVRHGVFGYTATSADYQRAVINWQERRHHFTARPEWLCHSPGVVAGLSLMVSAYTEPGDGVIIQPPVYHQFNAVLKALGRKTVDNPLQYDGHRYTIDFEDLEQKAQSAKLLFLCNPHNPIGQVWSRADLIRLGEICIRYGVLVIADEVHADLVLGDTPHVPFASISEEFASHSVTCVAPSKTFNLAGMQTAVVIIPDPDLRHAYDRWLHDYHLWGLNPLAATALIAAYDQGEEWLDQLLAYLRQNVALVCRFIAEKLPEIRVRPPEATYLMWLDCRALGLEEAALERFFVEEAGVGLDGGHQFGSGGSGFLRLNVALPQATLLVALKKMEQAVRNRSVSEGAKAAR